MSKQMINEIWEQINNWDTSTSFYSAHLYATKETVFVERFPNSLLLYFYFVGDNNVEATEA